MHLQLTNIPQNLMFDVCLTVHHQYNDVSNQQDATTFSLLIYLLIF